MADDLRKYVLLWVGVMNEAGAGPSTQIRCPFCQKGEIIVHDLASQADPTHGERFFRCTQCGRSTEARIAFGATGPLFPPPEPRPGQPDSRAALDFVDRAAGLFRS